MLRHGPLAAGDICGRDSGGRDLFRSDLCGYEVCGSDARGCQSGAQLPLALQVVRRSWHFPLCPSKRKKMLERVIMIVITKPIVTVTSLDPFE